ncbi:hypothetical protein RB595_001974 [Gaeumannomyces hyphopodioides]
MPLGSPLELKRAASLILSSRSVDESLKELREKLVKDDTAHGGSGSSLDDIATELATENGLGKRENLLALLAYLQDRSEGAEEAGNDDADSAALRRIGDFAARSICPIAVAPDDEIEGYHPTTADRARDLAALGRAIRPVAEPALRIAELLAPTLGPDAVVTAIAHADPSLPWTTPEAARRAADVARAVAERKGKTVLIADDVLRDYLRPLFSKSRPAAVTASGRRAEFAEEPGALGSLALETRAAKPWKHTDLRAVPVFAWALYEADKDLMAQHWPLFTPVLLTLLDDGDTDVRARGLGLLKLFLSKADGATLAATGLGSVFRDAVFPTLLFLPSVTPEAESLRLQEPAYAALVALSRVGSKDGSDLALLDRALRDGVFAAFFYARDYIRIVEVLVRHAGLIVEEMKVHAVKHLKDLIPMISSVMEEPFAMAHPPSLLAAIGALQAVIRNCWPRLGRPPWREEVVKSLVACWLRARDDVDDAARKQASDSVCAELARTAKMLAAVTRAQGTELAELVGPLTAREPLLVGLFGTTVPAATEA